MEQAKHIIIICGEASGDLQAGELARAIREIRPRIKISGVGGVSLRQAGAEIFCDIKNLAVLGLFDALKKLPRFFALKKRILQKIREEKPDAIILVDFSGFNLRLAKTLNKSLTTIYYVSPQVWASRPGRVKTIKKYIHRMIVLFKFEEEFYRRYGVKAAYVGHPLLDIVRPGMEKKAFLAETGLAESWVTIALLPGSRLQEINNILPIMLNAASLIRKKLPKVQFVIAKSPQVDQDIYCRLIAASGIDVAIVEGRTYDCLNCADFCLVASGTATLETAIMQKPFVILYKMSLLNYLLYRPQVKIPYIGMVNIVAKKKIIPEFVQGEASPQGVSEKVLDILQNPSNIQEMKSNLKEIASLLGERGAAVRAARIVLDSIENK